MQIRAYRDPIAFEKAALPRLLTDEAMNCVAIGATQALAHGPARPGRSYTALVVEDERVLGVVLMTPPYPLNLGDLPPAATEQVADYAASFADRPTGVIGTPATADPFAAHWCRRMGATVRSTSRQGVFQLDRVAPLGVAPGEMRTAGVADTATLLDWNRGFLSDCGLPPAPDAEHERAAVAAAITSANRFLWIAHGRPVAMAAALGKTPNGIRIAWVYTPPSLRRNGFATALVARLSDNLLRRGNRFCFLYTDLGNPTSNAIYQRIGYKRVGDAHHHMFGP